VWRFVFSGSGEPFLNYNATDFMRRAKQDDNFCIVNTAGFLLNKEKIDELVAMGFDQIRMTTMAGTAEMYKRTHPRAKDYAFDRIRDNLLYLADRKRALGVKRPEVRLFTIVISENYDSLMDFARFAAEVQADQVMYRPYDDVDDPGLAALVPTAEQYSAVKRQLAEVKPFLESKRIKNNIDHFLMICDKQINTSALYRIIPCYYGWASTQILASGKVFPCGRCYESFGDIYQDKFRDIWNGEAYQKFRAEAGKLNKRDATVSGANCNRCSHHAANLRVYRALHPYKRHSKDLENLSPGEPLKLA
jgi:MoaA/NifB/PqqE/SkfB family radical SAM enzyme